MVVEHVERFGVQLDVDLLSDYDLLFERDIGIAVRRSAHAADARARADGSGARKELDALYGAHNGNPLYLYWLARLDYDARRYEDAISKLRRVIAIDPQSARAYDSLGLALDMFGSPEEARAALEKAVDLNRRLAQPSPWPPNDLGALLVRLENWRAAEEALRESLRYDARFAAAHYHLGRVLEKEGKDPEALSEYKSAMELDPSATEACYSYGLLCRRMNRTADADVAFAEYRRRRAAANR